MSHLLPGLVLVLAAASSSAQCIAPNSQTGQMVQAIETPAPNLPYRAYSSYMPDGQPVISYGPGFFQLSPIMRTFVVMHECAHLKEAGANEFLANCRALQVMRLRGLSKVEEQEIAQSHVNDGPLPAMYGGSGSEFWKQTLLCAGPRTSN